MTNTSPPAARAEDAMTPGQFSWAFFQWARDFGGGTIMVFIFAPYFANFVVGDPVEGQSVWAYISVAVNITTVALGPCFGAIADAAGRRKPWLAAFAAMMAVASFSLWWSLPGGGGLGIWGTVLVMMVFAVGYAFSDMFHNSMLPSIAAPNRLGFLSGLGGSFSEASLVIGLSFVLYAFMLPGQVDWPFIPSEALFGVDVDQHENSRIIGPMVAIWLIVFSLPLFLLTPDTPRITTVRLSSAMITGFRRVFSTLRHLRDHKNVARFLLARMLYNDGFVGVLIFSAIYASGVFRWSALVITIYALLMGMVSVVAMMVSGWMDDKFGTKRTILFAVAGASLGLLMAVSMTPTSMFFFIQFEEGQVPLSGLPFFTTVPELIYLIIIIATTVFINSTFATGRSMLARIAPLEKMSEFFGLYALTGRITAFVGPLIVGLSTSMFQSQRLGMASLLVLTTAGFIAMFFVRQERATSSKPAA